MVYMHIHLLSTSLGMFSYVLWPFVVALVVILCLVRKVCVDALSSVVTREKDTFTKVQTALRVLCADMHKVQFVTTKDRSSHLGEGVSRRRGGRAAAKMLAQKRRREEKMSQIRKHLAQKLKFKKSL